MGELKKKTYQPLPLSIKDFHAKRNKILLWHDKGGLGDVYMHRMVFEDFKRIVPDAEFTFACLPEYMDAVKDHPFISEVIDSRTVNTQDYICWYNTCVTIADRHENKRAPFCLDHRSDIWAAYCGVQLENHNMHFVMDPKIQEKVQERLKQYRQPGKALNWFCTSFQNDYQDSFAPSIGSYCRSDKRPCFIGISQRRTRNLQKSWHSNN